ncbi:MAG: branched-chain amino acid ABC transporter permease [Deltaproteobacteria bacterium]|jgi:branched-chain amino acid transport system permease protein|nr:branched-chain amino acid ABC transporter permease [Deltaproteobacteria bacterium]
MLDAYTSQVLTFIGINCILALSLYVTVLAGQLSVGHAAFMGIGAYTSTLLVTKWGVPFFLSAPAGAVMGGLFGILIGLPTLRLKDLYLVIATLAFNIIWVVVVMNLEALGGALGIFNVPKATDNTVVFASLAVMVFFFYRLQDSRLGRAFRSIQEDEAAARAMGVNAVYYKVYAFSLGAFLAGYAGALYAHFVTFISPHDFEVDRSIEILLFVVLGGSQTYLGPLCGALLLTLAPEFLRFLAEYRLLVYGLMFVGIMLVRHEGLIEEDTFSWKRWSRMFRKESHGPSS